MNTCVVKIFLLALILVAYSVEAGCRIKLRIYAKNAGSREACVSFCGRCLHSPTIQIAMTNSIESCLNAVLKHVPGDRTAWFNWCNRACGIGPIGGIVADRNSSVYNATINK